MDETATRNIVEAALLAAGRPLTLDKLLELFSSKGVEVERADIRGALEQLGTDYESRGIELKEVASGYRIQVKSSARDWLDPLFEERAPRYTRALLETLALIAYRQPITRAEIEEVRGVAVSTNIIRTLLERGWIRIVGYRDIPGKPSMLGTTREFLDYFGLKRLEDLPPLSELSDLGPLTNPQSDLLDALQSGASVDDAAAAAAVPVDTAAVRVDVADDTTTDHSDELGAAGSEAHSAIDEPTTEHAEAAVAPPAGSEEIADDEPGDKATDAEQASPASADDEPASTESNVLPIHRSESG